MSHHSPVLVDDSVRALLGNVNMVDLPGLHGWCWCHLSSYFGRGSDRFSQCFSLECLRLGSHLSLPVITAVPPGHSLTEGESARSVSSVSPLGGYMVPDVGVVVLPQVQVVVVPEYKMRNITPP